ncbi:hypothetical protein [Polynucleobacter sp. MWH-UH2A]|uniref:hypothetical protein n=1 Tax=Polynucleobacter sp. MWH-UH2A TaxID=1855617 RepID=UPI001BFD687E|nr:hypothetical protein [Polynucleobacter sp. MWH-UH2A]QWD64185.1 hypothetical protein IC571_00690 [Polynucleobacter sp. MWH-UH2A]
MFLNQSLDFFPILLKAICTTKHIFALVVVASFLGKSMRHESNIPIAALISVCCLKDIAVWKVAAPRIVSNILAKKYYVVVPKMEIEIFKKNTPSLFEVVDEEEVIKGVDLDYVMNFMPLGNKGRAGWYFQQFLKIGLAEKLSIADEDIIVIWDADTVPLKEIIFFNEGKINLFIGSEYHPPYFELLHRLTGFGKLFEFSFIAQSIAFKKKWLCEFLFCLSANGKLWYEHILEKADLSQISGFSEYESLGTYMMQLHSDEILISDQAWERRGSQRFKGGNLSLKWIDPFGQANPSLAFITFEDWVE